MYEGELLTICDNRNLTPFMKAYNNDNKALMDALKPYVDTEAEINEMIVKQYAHGDWT